MSPQETVESPDCTEKCKSTQHGDLISAAITRRSVTDEELCSYLNYICTRCESVKDSDGRTALHMAASCGRTNLVKWLIHNRHANINEKDEESGFTPLHRSIFYGKINVAIELVKLGANTSLLDSDSLNYLEHAMKDGFRPDDLKSGELYVWGANSSNSLGPQQARTAPDLLDVFHKKHPEELISKVYLDKFHSVIFTAEGRIYTCGHGQGGRLGLGSQRAVITPELVKFPENNNLPEELFCKSVSIARDHTIFLLSDGNVYTCGLNTNKVLGLNPAPEHLLRPTFVRKFSDEISGVSSGQFHSVVWGPHAIYSWGLNGGQLGHAFRNDEKFVTSPKIVRIVNLSETRIETLNSSDGAICFYTKKGDVYVLHEFLCRKIASRLLNLVDLSIFGGKLDLGGKDELKVVGLTNTGNLLLWQESDPQLCRIVFNLNRAIIIKQVAINFNGLLFTSKDGEAFQGFIKPRKKKNSISSGENKFHKFLDREDCVIVKISKFPKIHRAIFISSDRKGLDFCVVQARPYKNFENVKIFEKSEFENQMNSLFSDKSDSDVVFKVGTTVFPCHRFILAAKSGYFTDFFNSGNLNLNSVLLECDELIFEQFLKFVYTGTCDLLNLGECGDKFRKFCDNKKSKNPVRILHEMAKKFNCGELCEILSNLDMQKFTIKLKNVEKSLQKSKTFKFDPKSLENLCDVSIKSANGDEIQAHKCILSARSDYFNNLFSSRWGGEKSTKISLPTTRNVIEALLEFLYTDDLKVIKDQDFLFKLLVLSDQLFITRLKQQCEFLLFDCINLRNCVQFLNFSHIYNAENLKSSCLKFIVYNIAPLLESRSFDDLDDDLLKQLTDFYFEIKEEIGCRVITPFSHAPSEELIVSVNEAFPVDFGVENCYFEKSSRNPQRKRFRSHRLSENSKIFEKPQKDETVSNDNVIQFPDSPLESDFLTSNIQNRLKSIKLAEEIVANDEISDSFIRLNKSQEDGDLSTSYEDFPVLNSPPNAQMMKSPHNKSEVHQSRLKITKLSQKQRKRLNSSSENVESPRISESPKNPWKIINDVPDLLLSTTPEKSMSEIISLEKKRKENLMKIQTKLLIYTQMEDKAIDDLRKFYNADDLMEEIITVVRADLGAVATPIWVPGVKK